MKIKQKIVAILMTILLVGTNLITLGNQVIAANLSQQNSKTNHTNVEFNSYFEEGTYSKKININEKAKLSLKIKVNEVGYLKNAQVNIQNSNYEIDVENLQNTAVEEVTKTQVKLKQIKSNEEVYIELPIKIKKEEKVEKDFLEKISNVIFTATYIDENGKEKDIQKTIQNQVIWQANPEVQMTGEVTKYVPYKQEEEYGVLLQTLVSSEIKDHILPISKTQINMQVPQIEGENPQRVTVIANKTQNTGSKNQSYHYEETTGKLNIQVVNEELNWTKTGKDEYVLNFIYVGEDLYQKALEQEYKAKVELTGEVTLLNEQTVEEKIQVNYEEKEQKGNLTGIFIKTQDTISKGQIYANYDQKEENQKKETTYEMEYTIQINDANLTDEVVLQTKAENYIDSKENKQTAGENSYIKQIKIEKEVITQLLGEEGTIQITKKDGSLIGTLNKEENSIEINEQDLSEVIIRVSKPQQAGNLKIMVQKAISANQSYTKEQMKEISKISTTVILENEKVEEVIPFTEPVSKAEVTIENTGANLSTMVVNKDVEIRVVLDTSNTQRALYKDPVFEIELPSKVEKIQIKDINLLLEDEMKIKQTKVIEKNGKKTIQITLEGTQSKYNEQIAKGATIILHADITLNKFAASSKEQVIMYYTNQNTNLYENTNRVKAKSSQNQEIGIAKTDLNIVAPAGVVTTNSMKGYDGNKQIESMNAQKQTATIEPQGEKKTVTVEAIVSNHYSNNLENVMILGRLPVEGNKEIDKENSLNSNFTMPMTKKIEVTGIEKQKVKIYYSTNIEASKDLINNANAWQEEAQNIRDVKSYLIMITGEVEKGATIGFKYEVELPENLSSGKESYQTYKVYYDNKTESATIGETKEAAVLGIATSQKPELEVTLSSNVEENKNVTDEQIVKFFVSAKNIGNSIAQNVTANIEVPEGASYVIYQSGTQQYEESNEKNVTLTIGDIPEGETKKVSYELKMKPGNLEKFTHQVEVIAKDLSDGIKSNTYTLNRIQTKLNMTLSLARDPQATLNKGDILYPVLVLQAKENLQNVVVSMEVPQGIKIASANYQDENEQEQPNYVKIENHKIIVTIPTIKADYLQSLKLTLEVQDHKGELKLSSTATAKEIEKVSSNELTYYVGTPEFEITQTTKANKYIKEAENITYEFTVENTGNADANEVVFENKLPEGLTFKKLEYTYEGNTKTETSTLDNTAKVRWTVFKKGKTATIKVLATADLLPEDKKDKTVENVASISSQAIETKQSNKIQTTIEYNEKLYEGNTGNQGTDKPNNTGSYKVTGTAWIDENKNGTREENEKTIAGMKVMLLQKSGSQVVKDIEIREEKTTTTKQDGSYEFNNLPQGEYIAVFLYDAGKYNITEYQKQGVSVSYNSDAVSMNITLDGKQRVAGITDTIKITEGNARDIDIGLYVAEKFDLKLDKTISKITLTTPTIGTKVYNYQNAKLQKIEVLGQNVNKSSMVVEYKIAVTNEGQVPGYVKKIIDYLPEDTKFSSELNKDWYISDNNNTVYNTSLENTLINPGETKEVTLILSMQITDKNIGTIINNNAEIYESYNEQGLEDIDSTPANKMQNEDDMSNADILLSIVTGKIVIYSTLTLCILFILAISIVIIQRKVLIKKKN
ncbi:MAG: hypothetical protein HFJ28_04565 [Clostridia bacterium]|nr:hypothetical protein [Clostridia bacterium]